VFIIQDENPAAGDLYRAYCETIDYWTTSRQILKNRYLVPGSGLICTVEKSETRDFIAAL
jgi:hypothetical protein